jgi:hypothetical protein
MNLGERSRIAVVTEALALEYAKGAAGRVLLVDEVADVLIEIFGHLGGTLILARWERGLGNVELKRAQLALFVRTLAFVDRTLCRRHRFDVVRVPQVKVSRFLHIGKIGQHLPHHPHMPVNTHDATSTIEGRELSHHAHFDFGDGAVGKLGDPREVFGSGIEGACDELVLGANAILGTAPAIPLTINADEDVGFVYFSQAHQHRRCLLALQLCHTPILLTVNSRDTL